MVEIFFWTFSEWGSLPTSRVGAGINVQVATADLNTGSTSTTAVLLAIAIYSAIASGSTYHATSSNRAV